MNQAWLAIVALAAVVPRDDSAELRRQRFQANAASDRSFYETLLALKLLLLSPDAVPRTKNEYPDAQFVAAACPRAPRRSNLRSARL